VSRHDAILWIDHHQAEIFRVLPTGFAASHLGAPAAVGPTFFDDVARALAGALQVLVAGPSGAKLSFIRHVARHDHALTLKIVGVETLAAPARGRLVELVRRYFEADVPPPITG
jgi:hypothetical protein